MYLDFHGLREPPFNLTPDPRFIFLSKTHREAFAHLLYGINHRAGFIALTGEVGTGKTTVLRSLLTQLDSEHYCTALIFNPSLSPEELLQTIVREFGVPKHASDGLNVLDALNQFLLKQNAEGRNAVLVIDEAQDLEASVLEQIRLISNLETDREKLIQIVLAGQPEMINLLNKKGMRQLDQRITVRYHLEAMDFEDTVRYINHRLEVAGAKGSDLFSKRSLKRIYRYSGGLPRLINAACDRALLAGYVRDRKTISGRIAARGIREMGWRGTPHRWRRRLAAVATFLLLLALGAGGIYILRPNLFDLLVASKQIGSTIDQPSTEAVITAGDLSRLMSDELGRLSEEESAREAFNTLAGLWNASPVAEPERMGKWLEIERLAEDRKLRVFRFSGNLGSLLRLNYPAALELRVPGLMGKRFVALVGVANEQLFVVPSLGGRESLSFSEIEKHWSGQAFLLWSDPLNLLMNGSPIMPGAKGVRIRELQGLLKEAGIYHRALTGIYDQETLSVVKALQSSEGIEQDGIVGRQTLMVLYRSIDRFKVPKIIAETK